VSAPYRNPPESPRLSLWRRLRCWFGWHDWVGPPMEFALGAYMPCAHCGAKLCRSRSRLGEWGGEHAYLIEHGPLPMDGGGL